MIRTIKHISLAIILVFFIENNLICQSNGIVNKGNGCGWGQPEKVFVHLARNIISAGEILPYKAYIASSVSGNQYGISAIVYFDIVDSKGNVLVNWRSNATDGVTSGKAMIPDSIRTGMYVFRAYTRWMINWSSDFVFQAPVLIMNYGDENLTSLPVVKYPQNQGKNKIALFDVKCKISNDSLIIATIPTSNASIFPNTNIVGYLHGELIFSEKNNVRNALSYSYNLKGNETGLISILVVDNQNKVLQDTLVEYTCNKKPELKVQLVSDYFKKGENVKMNISLNIPENITGQLSCAVRMQDTINVFNYSPQIDEYFNKYSEFSTSTWYNFLLENKKEYKAVFSWESAIWNKTIDKNKCQYLKETNKYLLSGRITDKDSNKVLNNIPVLLSTESSGPSINYCITNNKGEFYFWLDREMDNRTLVFQTLDGKKNSEIQWEIFPGLNQSSSLLSESVYLTDNDKFLLKQINDVDLINHIYYVSTENKSAQTVDSSIRFIVKPSYTIYPNDYDLLENFKEISDNIMPAVTLKEKKKNWQVQIYDGTEKIMLKPQEMVLLNGVPFTNLEYISKLPIESIDRIDVYTSHIILGRIDFYGLVAIYTNDKKLSDDIINKETFVYKNEVLVDNKEIVTGKKNSSEKEPDFRNLLYWNPDLEINSGQIKTIEFPASDVKGKYIIEIQGISNKGQFLVSKTEFTID